LLKAVKTLIILLLFGLGLNLKNGFSQYNPDKMIFTAKLYLQQKNATEAMPILNRVVAVYPENAEAFYLRGLAKYYLNDFTGAEADFSSALKIKPFYPEALQFRGVSRDMNMNFKGAIKDFEKALEQRPDDSDILTDYSISLLHNQQINEAKEAASKANRLVANNARTLLCLGAISIELEELTEAVEYFSRVLQITPSMPQAQINRGRAYLKMDSINLALNDFTQVLKLDPSEPMARMIRAQTYYDMVEMEKSLADLDSLLYYHPNHSNALYRKAILLHETGNNKEAIAYFNQLVTLNPDNFLAYYSRGSIFFGLNQVKEALNDIEMALNLYPSFADGWNNLYVILKRLGRIKEAEVAWEKVKQLNQLSEAEKEYQKGKFTALAPFKNDFDKASLGAQTGIEPFSPKFIAIGFNPNKTQKQPFDFAIRNFANQSNLQLSIKPLSELTAQNSDEAYIKIAQLSSEISSGKKTALNYFLRGTLYAQTENFAKSVEDLKNALAIDSSFFVARFNLAVIELEKLAVKSSFDELNQYIAPANNSAWVTYDSDYIQSELLSIVAEFDKILKAERNLSIALFNRAYVKTLLKDYNGAINDYEISTFYRNNFAEAYVNAGLIYLFFDNPTIACDNLSRAGELGIKEAYTIIKRYCNTR
jgi:tetratricopeptide (TPR) repeat protein